MIFVTVGSVAPFDTLIREVDDLAGRGLIKETVAQIGNGKYAPKNCKWFRFERDLKRYYQDAEIIITHNGAGTLFEVLPLGKKIIVVPNPDTSQIENIDIVIKLAKEGHIIPCIRPYRLEYALRLANNWVPRRYERPPCRIPDIITRFLLDSSEQK